MGKVRRQDPRPGDLGDIKVRAAETEGERYPEAKGPLVSVVIPCYNQGRFLGEAIRSVLAQSYHNFEVIVVDDGSTDDTAQVAGSFEGVSLIRQENRGLAEARNSGLAESRGEYVVFLDADDRLLPGALKIGIRELDSHPDCALVSGQPRLVSSEGSYLSTPPRSRIEGDPYLALLRYNYIWTPGVAMFRRAAFRVVGPYDASLEACADWDLYLRVARVYPVHHHGRVVADYRAHGANMTGDPARMLKATVTLLRSQREHVKGNERRTLAYRAGLKTGKEYYGGPLAEKVRAQIKDGRWGGAIKGLVVLARYYPRGIALLDERRMQQYRVTQQLRTLQGKLEDRKHKVRAYRRRLRALGEGSAEREGSPEDRLKSDLKKERQRIRRLRGRIRSLERRAGELGRRGRGSGLMRTLWEPLKVLVGIRAKKRST